MARLRSPPSPVGLWQPAGCRKCAPQALRRQAKRTVHCASRAAIPSPALACLAGLCATSKLQGQGQGQGRQRLGWPRPSLDVAERRAKRRPPSRPRPQIPAKDVPGIVAAHAATHRAVCAGRRRALKTAGNSIQRGSPPSALGLPPPISLFTIQNERPTSSDGMRANQAVIKNDLGSPSDR
jgi:hypothetical protein